MISLHINKAKSVQEFFKVEIEEQRSSALQKLQAINANIFDQAEQTYLNNVITQFQDISFLTKSPLEIEAIKGMVGSLPANSRFETVNGVLKPMKKQQLILFKMPLTIQIAEINFIQNISERLE